MGQSRAEMSTEEPGDNIGRARTGNNKSAPKEREGIREQQLMTTEGKRGHPSLGGVRGGFFRKFEGFRHF